MPGSRKGAFGQTLAPPLAEIGHHVGVRFPIDALVLVLIGVAGSLPAQARPNILVFLVDDMGWQDTSVAFWSKRTPANDHFRTPTMERLARQGVRFTNAYSHAVCSPTRTSIMTGQNPVRHHVTNWTLWSDRDQSGRWGRVGPPKNWRKAGIQPADVPLAMLMRDSGYFTIHCGKAHWGANGTKGSDPRNLGFDVNIAGHAAGGPGSYHGETNFGNKIKGGRTLPWGIPGLEAYHGQDVHLTDVCTVEAKKAVSRAVAAEKPFYLYMAHYAVHAPIQPHERFMAHYRGKKYSGTGIDIPPAEQRYASMVEGMDASLRSLLDHFEALGVAENTLVIFTSDNGGLSAHARGKSPRNTGRDSHNWPLRAGKASAYEGGTRVPFIVSWCKPDGDSKLQRELPLAAGTTSTQPLICEDLFPTLLGIAGVTIPEGRIVDGHDMRPYWTGERSAPNRRLVFHYPHVWGPRGPGYEPHSAMREGRLKVIYFYNARRWELYDLVEDLSEAHDLAAAEPRRLTELAATLAMEMKRLDVQWPVDRRTGVADVMQMPRRRPNVVFVSIDDLNDWVGCLGGHPQARTPNIDKLAAQGVLFTNANCAAPACLPSRTALMTGLAPHRTGIYQNGQIWRNGLPKEVTIPQHFMAHGYFAAGAGKIFHHYQNDPKSWHDYFPGVRMQFPEFARPKSADRAQFPRWKGIYGSFDWGPLDQPDAETGDWQSVSYVISELGKKRKRPFFLACGIYRPHVPWFVPRKYFDMFPLDGVQLPPMFAKDIEDLPAVAKSMVARHRYYREMVKHDQLKRTTQAYLASVAYTDMLIGRLMAAVDSSRQADNTIVVLWSDHGWHLGEKHHYRKFTLWEESCRVPLIVRMPKSMSGYASGAECSRPVNLLDLYPTLNELCGLKARPGLDGHSLVPLLKNPKAPWSHVSITTHLRGQHLIRSERWRYIRYRDGGEELYDHDNDPNEWTNLASERDHARTLALMRARLPKRDALSAETGKFNWPDYAKTYAAEIKGARRKECRVRSGK